MELSFTHRESSRKGAWVLVLVIALAYVVAIAHGVTTIDVARDLFWGIEIASGGTWPSVGPPVGPFELLSAIWYYVVAAAAFVSSSLTMYFALLGALAALKYVLIYRVALRWMGVRFALTLVVAATLPGMASYQLFGVSHTQFVEAAIWATALFALRLRAAPERICNALAFGACAALSLHAHPTSILLLPWAVVALISLPRRNRLRVTVAALVAATFVFLPLLVAMTIGMPSTSENVPGAPGLHGSISALTPLLQNLFWFQPKYVMQTALPAQGFAAAWPVLWTVLLALSAIGAVLAATDRRLAATFWASLFTLLGVLIGVALLRDHTPFYMLYVCLPPASILFASAWIALRNIRGGAVVASGILFTSVALYIGVCASLVYVARNGTVMSHLPLHSNMQDTTSSTHLESVSAPPTRDAVTRWLCAQPEITALHGDLAAAYDIGLGQEHFFHCKNRNNLAVAGGGSNAWTGFPLSVWRELLVEPTVVLGAYGLAPVVTVVSPASELQTVSGRAYPPRFALMISAASHGVWRILAQTSPSELLVVSSLLPTYPLFAATATANGVAKLPVAQFANTAIFRCQECGQSPVNWKVSVRGGAPESTSITVVAVRDGVANSASLRP